MASTTKVLHNNDTYVRCKSGLSPGSGQFTDRDVLCEDNASSYAERKRKKPKPLKGTPFQITCRWDDPATYGPVKVGPYWREGTHQFTYNTSQITTKSQSDDGSLSLARARHKIAGKENNFGETLVELSQTIDMINKRLTSVLSFFVAIQSGKWGKAASIAKGKVPSVVKKAPPSKRVASAYLEMQFGWKPLIEDVYKAVEAYHKGMLTRGQLVRSSSGPRRYDASKPAPEPVLGSATFRGRVKNANVATLNDLGLLNPALMAWNKLPLSFLVDWIYPISTVLGSLTAEAGLTEIIQTRTTVSTVDSTQRGKHVRGYRVYTRWVHDDSSVVIPSTSSLQLGLGKLVTLAALFRQRL